MRRMDRYSDEQPTNTYSRSNKNQELYQNIGSNTRIANFSDVTNTNAYDISKEENVNTREGYQKMKEYNSNFSYKPKEKRELEDIYKLCKPDEKKVYDINSVLQKARENMKDDLDSKRNLKNQDYNILSSKNKDDLNQYRKEKEERIKKEQEEELRNIIDKTVNGEIDQETTVNLLSDLMATNMMDAVGKPEKDEQIDIEVNDAVDKLILENTINQKKKLEEEKETSKEILNPEELEKLKTIKENNIEEINKDKNLNNSFYTGSMDLSDKDFMLEDEENKKFPLWAKIIILITVLLIAAAIGYFVYQYII